MLHGPISNERYVRRVVPFAKAGRGLDDDVLPKHRWQIYDSRSNRRLTVPCDTRAKAWRALADAIRANGGFSVNHEGVKPLTVCTDSAKVRTLPSNT